MTNLACTRFQRILLILRNWPVHIILLYYIILLLYCCCVLCIALFGCWFRKNVKRKGKERKAACIYVCILWERERERERYRFVWSSKNIKSRCMAGTITSEWMNQLNDEWWFTRYDMLHYVTLRVIYFTYHSHERCTGQYPNGFETGCPRGIQGRGPLHTGMLFGIIQD